MTFSGYIKDLFHKNGGHLVLSIRNADDARKVKVMVVEEDFFIAQIEDGYDVAIPYDNIVSMRDVTADPAYAWKGK